MTVSESNISVKTTELVKVLLRQTSVNDASFNDFVLYTKIVHKLEITRISLKPVTHEVHTHITDYTHVLAGTILMDDGLHTMFLLSELCTQTVDLQ